MVAAADVVVGTVSAARSGNDVVGAELVEGLDAVPASSSLHAVAASSTSTAPRVATHRTAVWFVSASRVISPSLAEHGTALITTMTPAPAMHRSLRPTRTRAHRGNAEVGDPDGGRSRLPATSGSRSDAASRRAAGRHSSIIDDHG